MATRHPSRGAASSIPPLATPLTHDDFAIAKIHLLGLR